ncbi:MAG: PAS domain-containing protein [Alphaproteobacteria bacterium]|nr:PAS domain-containing protein [Alphaproteobacteria bacterium]
MTSSSDVPTAPDAAQAELQRLRQRLAELEARLAAAEDKAAALQAPAAPTCADPVDDPAQSLVGNMRGIALFRRRDGAPTRLFGFDAQAITGVLKPDGTADCDAWRRAIAEEDLPSYMAAQRRLCETGEAYGLEFRYTNPLTGRTVWLREQSYAGHDHDGGPCYDGFILDVTAEKTRERLLQDATDSAILADRAKTQFLANVSHELRTPLHAIVGFADLMIDQAFGPLGSARYLEYSRDIHSSATHLQRLIEEILDFAKADAGKDEVRDSLLDIGDLINSALRMVREHAARNGLTLSVDIDERLPQLRADERKMRQILLNLLSNAIKFTRSGGTVRVSAAERPDGSVTLSVADSGIGIAPEDVPRAFEPFVQLDTGLGRQHEGTGLGLPLSAKLAALHEGALTLESRPGQGTTARLAMPPNRSIRPRPVSLPHGQMPVPATDPGA